VVSCDRCIARRTGTPLSTFAAARLRKTKIRDGFFHSIENGRAPEPCAPGAQVTRCSRTGQWPNLRSPTGRPPRSPRQRERSGRNGGCSGLSAIPAPRRAAARHGGDPRSCHARAARPERTCSGTCSSGAQLVRCSCTWNGQTCEGQRTAPHAG